MLPVVAGKAHKAAKELQMFLGMSYLVVIYRNTIEFILEANQEPLTVSGS